MELKARYTFDATAAHVWALLMNPVAIAQCLPGCQTFEPIGDDRYRVVLTAGVAAVSGTFEGTVSIADKQPEKSYRLIVDGSGRAGFAKGESTITLTPEHDKVAVDVVGVVNVGGLVAQVGQRLIGATARMMMDRFFNCLQGRM
jgi:carbon monoxide dehydrogenase subunit G